jgi:hypothetical protein
MSARRHTSKEPVPLGPDDRLHNSGYGGPPVRYTTPGIGARFTLDYMALLRSWPGAGPEDARDLASVLPRDERIPAALIARYAHALTESIGRRVRPNAERDAETALVALGDAVRERGLVDGVVLTARANDLYKEKMYARQPLSGNSPSDPPPSDEQVAVALVTLVSCSPPLVLWGREPSLAMLRSDKALLVARLRSSHASPEANRVWTELQNGALRRGAA